MKTPKKTMTSAIALLSLSLAFPLSAGGANAACLTEVESLRAQLEQGRIDTLDQDQSAVAGKVDQTGKDKAPGAADIDVETTGSIGTSGDTAVQTRDPAAAEMHATAEGAVDVDTFAGAVEVPVGDGEPRENWFGRSPSLETVEEYLDSAETAANEGDEEACLEQLANARTAVTVKAE